MKHSNIENWEYREKGEIRKIGETRKKGKIENIVEVRKLG